jgi:hypothetical protein
MLLRGVAVGVGLVSCSLTYATYEVLPLLFVLMLVTLTDDSSLHWLFFVAASVLIFVRQAIEAVVPHLMTCIAVSTAGSTLF